MCTKLFTVKPAFCVYPADIQTFSFNELLVQYEDMATFSTDDIIELKVNESMNTLINLKNAIITRIQ